MEIWIVQSKHSDVHKRFASFEDTGLSFVAYHFQKAGSPPSSSLSPAWDPSGTTCPNDHQAVLSVGTRSGNRYECYCGYSERLTMIGDRMNPADRERLGPLLLYLMPSPQLPARHSFRFSRGNGSPLFNKEDLVYRIVTSCFTRRKDRLLSSQPFVRHSPHPQRMKGFVSKTNKNIP